MVVEAAPLLGSGRTGVAVEVGVVLATAAPLLGSGPAVVAVEVSDVFRTDAHSSVA
jgi:hypothetical protein